MDGVRSRIPRIGISTHRVNVIVIIMLPIQNQHRKIPCSFTLLTVHFLQERKTIEVKVKVQNINVHCGKI